MRQKTGQPGCANTVLHNSIVKELNETISNVANSAKEYYMVMAQERVLLAK